MKLFNIKVFIYRFHKNVICNMVAVYTNLDGFLYSKFNSIFDFIFGEITNQWH